MTDEDPWQRVLLDALAVLRLPPEVQLRVNDPGCVACNLISDFENEVLRRQVWQQLRELAAETLQVFRWEGVTVMPFKEIEPGVWHLPHADAYHA